MNNFPCGNYNSEVSSTDWENLVQCYGSLVAKIVQTFIFIALSIFLSPDQKILQMPSRLRNIPTCIEIVDRGGGHESVQVKPNVLSLWTH